MLADYLFITELHIAIFSPYLHHIQQHYQVVTRPEQPIQAFRQV